MRTSLTVLAAASLIVLGATGAVAAPADAAAGATRAAVAADTSSPTTPPAASVNLRDLENDTIQEINRMRANPAELADRLHTMRINAKPNGSRLEMTAPDGTFFSAEPNYIDSAIAHARASVPMGPIVRVDGLDQATRKFVDKNPTGHFSFNSTPSSRVAEFGFTVGGPGEIMSYGGSTGLAHAYLWYIDQDNAGFGHRLFESNPAIKVVGIGCYYPNEIHNITCVVDGGEKFIPLTDTLKPEIGKQYAFPRGNGKFSYAKLDSLNPAKIYPCPAGKAGWGTLGDVNELLTEAVALKQGLVPDNQPCDPAQIPHGTLRNGGYLPITPDPTAPPSSASNSTAPNSTATSTSGAATAVSTNTPAASAASPSSTGSSRANPPSTNPSTAVPAQTLDFRTATGAKMDTTKNYRLQTEQSQQSSRCLEGNTIAAGAVLDGSSFMDTCKHAIGQLWTLVATKDPQYYHLQTRQLAAQFKCFDSNTSPMTSILGGASFMNNCTDAYAQDWRFVDAGNGTYRMQTRISATDNKCLEGNQPADIAFLKGASFMNSCLNATGELWTLVPA